VTEPTQVVKAQVIKAQVIKAMAVIRRPSDGALLVSLGVSPGAGPFHRPLGGHVEFGEYAADTLRREFREEIGQDLTDLRLLGVAENIFTWAGELQHEIVFLYSAGFADPAAYEIEEQTILDQPATRVIWRPAGAVSPPLYPDAVTGLLLSTSR
jgi:ADP-ribose pyrophosphatase YjhB (NUDIX family)